MRVDVCESVSSPGSGSSDSQCKTEVANFQVIAVATVTDAIIIVVLALSRAFSVSLHKWTQSLERKPKAKMKIFAKWNARNKKTAVFLVSFRLWLYNELDKHANGSLSLSLCVLLLLVFLALTLLSRSTFRRRHTDEDKNYYIAADVAGRKGKWCTVFCCCCCCCCNCSYLFGSAILFSLVIRSQCNTMQFNGKMNDSLLLHSVEVW